MVVCGGEPGAGSQNKSVFTSSNGGVTWTTKFECSLGGATGTTTCPADDPLPNGYLGGIDAVSGDVAYLFGARNSLLKSTDGGRTWSLSSQQIGYPDTGTGPAIYFNRSEGVVLAKNGGTIGGTIIWSTTDAGETWKSYHPAIAGS
jgi:photosystem II stability/assembly factor-like uncharacterized protein